MVQDAVDTHMSGAQAQNTTLIHSMPKKCVASVEGATTMTKQRMKLHMVMVCGFISMAQLEYGPYQVMVHQVIGQEMTVTTVALGATMMAKQISEPGRALTILNQVNGSQPPRIHTQDIWL